MAIAVGQAAPDFTLKDQSMKEVKLADFKGKKNVVLVFYPLDWSPTCTNEHACFVNEMKQFETLDAQVLGVSVDSTWSHKAYAEKMGIKYPLLADFQPRGPWRITGMRGKAEVLPPFNPKAVVIKGLFASCRPKLVNGS